MAHIGNAEFRADGGVGGVAGGRGGGSMESESTLAKWVKTATSEAFSATRLSFSRAESTAV